MRQFTDKIIEEDGPKAALGFLGILLIYKWFAFSSMVLISRVLTDFIIGLQL